MGIPGLYQFVDRADPAIGRSADWRESSPPSSKAEVLLVDGYAVMYHVFNQTYDGKTGLGFPLKACGARMSQVITSLLLPSHCQTGNIARANGHKNAATEFCVINRWFYVRLHPPWCTWPVTRIIPIQFAVL